METNSTLVDNYFSLLRNLSPEIKRELIGRLSDSIKNESHSEDKLDSLFGAWKGDESAEDLIKMIRESRIDSQRDIEF